MKEESILYSGLEGCYALITHTNLPVTWHFVDNFAGYCTGLKATETTNGWLDRFFVEMSIPRENVGYIKDSLGREKLNYPNPFARYPTPIITNLKREVLFSPWANLRYLSNGKDYADTFKKDKDSWEYNKLAKMSVAFFVTKKLHDLLYSVFCARARKFCQLYPSIHSHNHNRFHQIESFQYIKLGDWSFWKQFSES